MPDLPQIAAVLRRERPKLLAKPNVTVDVEYGAGKVARFHDQLLTEMRSAGGDSGSAVLDTENRLVGLLFAGSDTVTVVNRIEHVMAALKLTGVVGR